MQTRNGRIPKRARARLNGEACSGAVMVAERGRPAVVVLADEIHGRLMMR